jgi:Ca2+-binding EF-hand superfamily protein
MKAAPWLRAFVFLMVIGDGSLPSSADAQEDGEDSVRETILVWMYHPAQKVRTAEELRSEMRWSFFRTDVDGGGISERDRELTASRWASTQSAQRIAETMTLDLNWDGKVTSDELRLALRHDARISAGGKTRPELPQEAQIEETLETYMKRFLSRDLDGDGVLTLEEVFEESRQRVSLDQSGLGWIWPLPNLAFDIDGNKVVSATEFEIAVDPIIEEFDTDGDGRFSDHERRRLRAAASSMQRVLRDRAFSRTQRQDPE